MSRIVEMRGITKIFPGRLRANDNINFELEKGEIHALLGENGAGKTTLMRILFGLYQPDEGEIWIRGQKATVKSPRDAIHFGLGMVHQHFMLIPAFTVTENIILGLRQEKGFLLDMKSAEKRISELSEKYGLSVSPRAKTWQLSVGERQRVEIIKNLYRGADVLILDEPTAVLTPKEVDTFFKVLTVMAKDGNISIVFITHKLDEVIAVSDRVTVLRGGKVVDTVETSKSSKKELGKMMVGRDISFQVNKEGVEVGEAILNVENLSVDGDNGLPAIKNVSFSIRQGEILGFAGVEGNGQKELVEAITRLRDAKKGKITVCGSDVTKGSVRETLKLGVCHIPADRLKTGLMEDLSVEDNLMLKMYCDAPFSNGRLGMLNSQAISKRADDLICEYDIRTPSKEIRVGALSGGNLQKLILARELSGAPRLIVASNPTTGLDIAATEFVHKKIIEQKSKGAAVLLVSADLDEVLSMSDRVAAIRNGEIVGILRQEEATREKVGLLMLGVKS